MKYTPIIGSLGYVLSPDQRQVLLVHRNARMDDDHLGKYNGLGGKMLLNESIHDCMKREILEEAGIHATEMHLRGVMNWTGFGPKGENWLGFVFLITKYEGIPWEVSPEGPLHFMNLDEIMSLPMWEGDREFLPLVFDGDSRPFYGYMAYDNDKMLSFSFSR